MGIKEIFKSDRCISCGTKLEVFSWSKCYECTTYKHKTNARWGKRNYQLPRMTIYRVSDVLKVFKIHSSLNAQTLQNKEYLVYDENNTIIGYK